tara:strand:- start:68768 stop:69361 length:594 start_codon:yes stop_codon:yes gene_type:complete
MEWVWIFSIFIGMGIGALPMPGLACWLSFGRFMPVARYGSTALTLWYGGHRLTSLLFIVCEWMKPVLTFIVVRMIYHNDEVALYSALMASIVGVFISFFKVKVSKSPLNLIGFTFILSPLAGAVLIFIYVILLFMLRRAHTACIIVCLVTPCLVIFTSSAQTPLIVGFALPLLLLFNLRKELLTLHLLQERRLPPLL